MKAAAPWLAVAIALIALYAMRGLATGAIAEADLYERAAEVARAEADSARRANVVLAAAVDSARVSEQRAREATDSVTRDVALRSSRAVRAARESSVALRASLDSTQAVELDRIEAEWASVVAAKDEQVAALESQVSIQFAGIASRDALIVGLREEIAAEVAIRTQLTLANGALRGAVRRSRIEATALRGATALLAGLALYQAVGS